MSSQEHMGEAIKLMIGETRDLIKKAEPHWMTPTKEALDARLDRIEKMVDALIEMAPPLRPPMS